MECVVATASKLPPGKSGGHMRSRCETEYGQLKRKLDANDRLIDRMETAVGGLEHKHGAEQTTKMIMGVQKETIDRGMSCDELIEAATIEEMNNKEAANMTAVLSTIAGPSRGGPYSDDARGLDSAIQDALDEGAASGHLAIDMHSVKDSVRPGLFNKPRVPSVADVQRESTNPSSV